MPKPLWIKPLKEFKTTDLALVIPVVGFEPNVGATHFSIMLGSYLIKNRYKVAILECSKNDAIKSIELAYEGENFDDSLTNSFKVKGITYYKDAKTTDVPKLRKAQYDVLILDIGTYISEWYEEIIRGDQPMFIGFYSDWKRRTTKEAILRYKDMIGQRSKVLLRSIDPISQREAKKDLGCKIYGLPDWPDAFVRAKEHNELMRKIMED